MAGGGLGVERCSAAGEETRLSAGGGVAASWQEEGQGLSPWGLHAWPERDMVSNYQFHTAETDLIFFLIMV